MNKESFWNSEKEISNFFNKPANERVVNCLTSIENKPEKRALDIGCGGGRHTELLANLGFDTYAIDTSKGMLTRVKKRLSKYYNEKELDKRIKNSSMLSLPFDNNFFDVIVCTGVFHQATSEEEFKKAIIETKRVIKKKGILITEVFTNDTLDDSYKFLNDKKTVVLTKEGLKMTLLSKNEYLDLLKKNGFALDNMICESKNISTGLRYIVRAIFYKL